MSVGVDESSTSVRSDWRVRLTAGAWLVAMVVTVLVVLSWSRDGLIDLRVYRTGGAAWLADVRLYADQFPKPLDGPALPFTYPPIAAVLFGLLALLPWPAAVVGWTAAGLVLLTVACLVSARQVYGPGPAAAVVGMGVAAVSVLFEPVQATLGFGQVNLVILGLVVADCLLPRTPWPRGLLIGLAAAIKLTPAIFVLFFLPRRQWRPVGTAAASFVGFGLLGFVLAPTDSREYWLGALLDPSRVGGLPFVGNQSLNGMLIRIGLTDLPRLAVWALLGIAVLALVWVTVLRTRRAGNDLAGLLAVAVGGLLISPVSWSHHWVWIVPGVVLLTRAVWRRPQLAFAAAPLVAVFVDAPQWRLPHRDGLELRWQWWQQLAGNAYVWAGLGALVALALGWRVRAGQADPATGPATDPAADPAADRQAGPDVGPDTGLPPDHDRPAVRHREAADPPGVSGS
ncbi:MAG TPA: glycosyltransferase 87 family protein [Cryptosporangiaceae bacterium]|nr:glycosyltransferase 87 family protein [Cryptosporangiaceae bacterium]